MTATVYRLILNCPDRGTARRIAGTLLDAGLVACANIYPEIESHYVWQGSRVSETEVPLVLKTRAEHVAAIEAMLAELHPYDVPPLVGQVLDFATADYAGWVAEVTRAP